MNTIITAILSALIAAGFVHRYHSRREHGRLVAERLQRYG